MYRHGRPGNRRWFPLSQPVFAARSIGAIILARLSGCESGARWIKAVNGASQAHRLVDSEGREFICKDNHIGLKTLICRGALTHAAEGLAWSQTLVFTVPPP